MIKFVGGMNLVFKDGRAGAAAKLHLVQDADSEGGGHGRFLSRVVRADE